jgi:hypothetical protein
MKGYRENFEEQYFSCKVRASRAFLNANFMNHFSVQQSVVNILIHFYTKRLFQHANKEGPKGHLR